MVKEPYEDPQDRNKSDEQSCELFAGQEQERNFPTDFPLSYAEIALRQQEDNSTKQLLNQPNKGYQMTHFPHRRNGYNLITKGNKIVLPQSMRVKAIQWYHETLMHPGKTCTELTMGQHFTWEGMQKEIQQACKRCQQC